MSTRVGYTKLFEKQLSRCPKAIQQKALFWVKTVEGFGIREVRKKPGYHDEPLKGKRSGQRSIRLSKAYRLIYQEIEKEIHIEAMEVHKHEY
ncbi:MAG: hypothetical protein H6626_05425 [Pseudobdellovibrionaceae bacterium]|nr:MAG: hypothetical protein H6626_05425 [Pseudobdellovibrionaceae bacterium]